MARQPGSRQARIGAQMQRALAQLLLRGVKDPRVGRLTVTEVEVMPDLSAAKVYYLPFGKVADPEGQLEGLRSAASFLRGEVAREVGLRHAPRLEFILDRQLEQATHLSQLIDKAVASDRAHDAHDVSGASAEPDPDDRA